VTRSLQIAKTGGTLTAFKPEEARTNDAKADAIIDYAKRIRDWPLLEEAVDHKIEEQEEFVEWWRASVGPRQSPGRAGVKSISDLKSISVEQASQFTGITPVQVSRWSKRLEDRQAYRAILFGAAYQKAMMEAVEGNHRAQGTGENEWYTPTEYLNSARDVLGEIDLDPATSDEAQKIVRATKYYTKQDNGLLQDWHGRVWLNPPYTQPDIANFVSKMVAERKAGRVTHGIMLTHNYTDTAWFHEAMTAADAVCFTRGRIKFYDAKGETAAPTQGQAFFYFGDDVAAFGAKFASVGFIVKPYWGEVDNAS